jgi:predicted naringenin-chalcone synthase
MNILYIIRQEKHAQRGLFAHKLITISPNNCPPCVATQTMKKVVPSQNVSAIVKLQLNPCCKRVSFLPMVGCYTGMVVIPLDHSKTGYAKHKYEHQKPII